MPYSYGAALARQKYDAWGNIRSGGLGAMPTDVGFTAQRSDATGLMYFKARYYAPSLGRFISADTIVPEPASPQSLNRYAYSLSNPLKYTDPTGHDVDCGIGESGCKKRPPRRVQSQPPEMQLRDCLLELLLKREAGEFDDLGLMNLFLQKAFDLHDDRLGALYAATRVVRETVPDLGLGFGYDERSENYYGTATSLVLSDTGFGDLRDADHNQVSHFIGEAYITLYEIKTGGGRIGAHILIYLHELQGSLKEGQWNQADIDLGLIASQYAMDVWRSTDPNQALTTAISSIRSFQRPISYEPGPGPNLWP